MSPLEDARVEETLTIDWGGEAVTLVARANWGAEVRLSGRHVPLTAVRDRRGWPFAVMAAHKPETRYAFRGHITPRGHEVIRELVAGLLGPSPADEPVIIPIR